MQIDCQIWGRQSLFVCWVQSVAVCGDCFEVAGPSNSTVALYDYGANSTSTFQLVLDWDPSYLGPITLDLVPPARWTPHIPTAYPGPLRALEGINKRSICFSIGP